MRQNSSEDNNKKERIVLNIAYVIGIVCVFSVAAFCIAKLPWVDREERILSKTTDDGRIRPTIIAIDDYTGMEVDDVTIEVYTISESGDYTYSEGTVSKRTGVRLTNAYEQGVQLGLKIVSLPDHYTAEEEWKFITVSDYYVDGRCCIHIRADFETGPIESNSETAKMDLPFLVRLKDPNDRSGVKYTLTGDGLSMTATTGKNGYALFELIDPEMNESDIRISGGSIEEMAVTLERSYVTLYNASPVFLINIEN